MAFIDLARPGGPAAVGETVAGLDATCDRVVLADPELYAQRPDDQFVQLSGAAAVAGARQHVPIHLEERRGGQGPTPPWGSRVADNSLISRGGGQF